MSDDDLAPWRKLGDVLGKILDGVAGRKGKHAMSRNCQLKFARDAKRFAERCGYANVSVGYLRRHPVLRGVINGKPIRVVIPGTPGDQRGRQNLYAGLRRLAREARP